MQAIKQLHPDIITNVQSKTLFSKEEEHLLGTVLSVSTQRSRVICYGHCTICKYTEVTCNLLWALYYL